jgi:general stress protein YciG
MAKQNPGSGSSKQSSAADRLDGSSRSSGSGRGFAAMSDGEQREIARKGGETVSQDRQHMADIGRKGGAASADSRATASSKLHAGEAGGSMKSSGRSDGDSQARNMSGSAGSPKGSPGRDGDNC